VKIERRQPPVIPPRPMPIGRRPSSPSKVVSSPVEILVPPKASDAFVEYARRLTPEGGILVTYMDGNVHGLWPVVGRTFATGSAKWLIETYSPTESVLINVGCFLLAILVNRRLFFGRPVAVRRSIEVRADCMILDSEDVFWLAKIGDNWPVFQADKKFRDRQVLCGIYGNRFVEYTSVYRFDELDRTPEVLASHLHDAMMKLWGDDGAEDNGPVSPTRRRHH
jgi:hypothetical protein